MNMETEELKLGVAPEQFKMAVSGIAAANPGLYFFMKYWHIILITFLLILVSVIGFGAWKYHEYMNEKLVAVNVELTQYKDQANILTENMDKMREDIRIADAQRQQFEKEITEIRRANAELRGRINGLAGRIPPGTPPAEAQTIVDELRNEIYTKWINIQEKKDEK